MTRAGNATYDEPDDLAPVVPVFPLPGALLFPRRLLPLDVFEPRYLAMVRDVLSGDRLIGVIQPRVDRPGADLAGRPALERVGTVGRLTQFAETGDGHVVIALVGICRFRIVEEMAVTTPYRQVRIDAGPFADDFRADAGPGRIDREAVFATLRAFVEARNVEVDWAQLRDAGDEALVDGLAMLSPCGPKEKQALLETSDLSTRAALLVAVTERALADADPTHRGPLQ